MSEHRDLPGLLDEIHAGLGLRYAVPQADVELSVLPGWDSMHLLRLVVLMERWLRVPVPVSRLLGARTLREIHQAAVGHCAAVAADASTSASAAVPAGSRIRAVAAPVANGAVR